jgi:hypothetical protein
MRGTMRPSELVALDIKKAGVTVVQLLLSFLR